MNMIASADDIKNFERNKNVKALAYTIVVLALLLLLFLMQYITQPVIAKPLIDEGVEVNLGNSETGIGDIPPQTIGETGTQQSTSSAQETVSTNTSNNDGDEETNMPPKVKEATIKPTVITTPKPVNTEPKKPTPKAVFGPPSKNTSGNNSNVDNGFKNQGIAGGKGDQGNPNGNPNSDSYKGNSSSGSGLSIKNGLNGRRISTVPKFEDEFTENAKVVVDVTVDANGNVTGATVNQRGTTTANATIKKIAIDKAYKVKFSGGKDEDFGSIVFSFRVTN